MKVLLVAPCMALIVAAEGLMLVADALLQAAAFVAQKGGVE